MTRKLIFADPGGYGGHHPMAQQLYLKALLSMEIPLITLTGNPERLRADMEISLPGSTSKFESETLPEPKYHKTRSYFISRHREAVSSLTLIRSAIEKMRAREPQTEFVILSNYTDTWLSPFMSPAKMDSYIRIPWAGMHMHPYRARSSGFRAWVGRRFLAPDRTISARNCKAIAVLDTGTLPRLQASHPNTPILPMPDPSPLSVEDADADFLRKVEAFRAKRKLVLLPGELSPRKGLFTFLKTMELSACENLCFAAVGKLREATMAAEQLAWVKKTVSDHASRMLFHPGHLESEDTLNALVRDCDVFWGAYDDFANMSSLLTKASFFHRPSIVSDGFFLAELMREYRLGEVVPNADPEAAIAAIQRLAFEEPDQPFGFERFSKDQSYERFVEQWGKVLKHLGMR